MLFRDHVSVHTFLVKPLGSHAATSDGATSDAAMCTSVLQALQFHSAVSNFEVIDLSMVVNIGRCGMSANETTLHPSHNL